MNSLFKKTFLFSIVAILGIGFSSGCRKKEDTTAIIYVRDINNNFVQGAQVVLFGQSTTGVPVNVVLYDTAVSNAAGEALFNFNDVYQLGQAGVAVLNIEASKSGASGQGIIKIEQETVSKETVFIQ
jgi:hypothetical protein